MQDAAGDKATRCDVKKSSGMTQGGSLNENSIKARRRRRLFALRPRRRARNEVKRERSLSLDKLTSPYGSSPHKLN